MLLLTASRNVITLGFLITSKIILIWPCSWDLIITLNSRRRKFFLVFWDILKAFNTLSHLFEEFISLILPLFYLLMSIPELLVWLYQRWLAHLKTINSCSLHLLVLHGFLIIRQSNIWVMGSRRLSWPRRQPNHKILDCLYLNWDLLKRPYFGCLARVYFLIYWLD